MKGRFGNAFDAQEVSDTTRIGAKGEAGSPGDFVLGFGNGHLQFGSPQKSSKFALINCTTWRVVE